LKGKNIKNLFNRQALDQNQFSLMKERFSNFVLKESRKYDDLGFTVYLYEHSVHRCPFLWIKNEDEHNFFSVSFRTPPLDDSGYNHMIEHLTLHGSKNYPILSVFHELLKRSYSTYLNAFTSTDLTSYPFSTVNFKDYMNNLNVYLDCAFNPKLNEIDFLSECHHLEFVDNDITKPLRRSGVVYNEMCGDFSKPSTVFNTEVLRNLYPDSCTKHVFGGVPSAIAKSTIQDLRSHRAKFYHPSNTLFYHYGNFNPDEIFAKVSSVIDEFEYSEPCFPKTIYDQPRWNEPRKQTFYGPSTRMASLESQNIVGVSWIVGNLKDDDLMTDMYFIQSLLATTNNSPIYQNLIGKGIGTSISSSRFHGHYLYPFFSIVVSGVKDVDTEKVESIILETLENSYKEGFSQERIQSILHSIEFQSKQVSAEYGQELFENIYLSWHHGVSPFELVDINGIINRLKARINENPRYFSELIKKYFIDNMHRLTSKMIPDENFQQKILTEEDNELEQLKNSMSEEEKLQIVAKSEELLMRQLEPQPVHLLPSIRCNDISRKKKFVFPEENQNGVSYINQITNGITYVNIKGTVSLSSPIIQYLPLLKIVFAKIGCGRFDDKAESMFIESYTSKISMDIIVAPSLSDPNDSKVSFVISSGCLDNNVDKMIEILTAAIFDPHLDNKKCIKEKFDTYMTNQARDFVSNAMTNTILSSHASINKACTIVELLSGYSHYQTMVSLSQMNDWDKISSIISEVYHSVFLKGLFSMTLTCSPIQKEKTSHLFWDLIAKLNQFDKIIQPSQYLDEKLLEYRSMKKKFIDNDMKAGYTSLCWPSVPYSDKHSRQYQVLSILLKNEFLNKRIRELLGAYGAIAHSHTYKGTVYFGSYRDRSPYECIDVILQSLDEVSKGNIDDEMVERAIISSLSKSDAPRPPRDEGIEEFKYGLNPQSLEERREIVFNTTKEDLMELASTLLKTEPYICINTSTSIVPPKEDYSVITIKQ